MRHHRHRSRIHQVRIKARLLPKWWKKHREDREPFDLEVDIGSIRQCGKNPDRFKLYLKAPPEMDLREVGRFVDGNRVVLVAKEDSRDCENRIRKIREKRDNLAWLERQRL